MKTILLQITLSIGLIVHGLNLHAQCTVTATASNTTIPCGSCVTLSATGTPTGTTAFREDFNNGNPTGWDFTQSVTIGNNTCGVPSPDGTPFMWMGSSSINPRDMTTVGFDLSNGGTICFEMRYAIQSGTSPCEGPDLPNEGVHLQYSINNGVSWTDIDYWPPLGGSNATLTAWNQYCRNIPAAAQTTNTKIRWHQDAVSGAGNDHWGIDNVEISVFGPPYQITWAHDNYSLPSGTLTGNNPTQVCLDSAKTFEVTMTNGISSCTTQVTININYPRIDNVVLDDPDCGRTDGSIQVIASGGAGGYQYSIDDSTTFQAANTFGSLGGNIYYVVLVDQNHCYTRDTVELFAVAPMAIINNNFTSTTCGENNGKISFSATGGTPAYQYSINNGTSFQTTNLYEQLPPGSYTMVAKDTKGCTVSLPVNIDPSSNPKIDLLTINPEMCSLKDGKITVQASLGIMPYNYSIDAVNNQLSNVFNGLSGGTYTLVITDNLGCIVDSTFTIGMTPAPFLPIKDSTLCGLTLQITGTTSVTGAYWSSPTGTSFSDPYALNPIFTANQSGTYTLNFKDTVCNVNKYFKVNFVPVPQTNLHDTVLCIGSQYTLLADHFPQNQDYTWNTGYNGRGLQITEEGLYVVTVVNMCGMDEDSAFVDFIICDLDLPNVFTPNGDGANDYFSLVQYSGIETFSCVIVNRWGNVMGEFSEPAFAWDGKDTSGNEATEGTYFYVVKAITKGGKEILKQGMVALIRN